jgi:hypothetical protein
MANQKLTAVKSLRYGGRRYKEGDPFEASDRYARLYIALGKAKARYIALGKAAAKVAPAAAPAPAAPAPAPTSTAVGGMTQRAYKTRDLTPEK